MFVQLYKAMSTPESRGLDIIEHPIQLLKAVTKRQYAGVPTRWRYDAVDPYAVGVVFPGTHYERGEVRPNVVTFARQLASSGLHAPMGMGWVHFRPRTNDETGGTNFVYMRVGEGGGSSTYLVPVPRLVDFINETHTHVLPGSESRYQQPTLEIAANLLLQDVNWMQE